MKKTLCFLLVALTCLTLFGCTTTPPATTSTPAKMAASAGESATKAPAADAPTTTSAVTKAPEPTVFTVDESKPETFTAMIAARPQHADLANMPLIVEMCQKHNISFEFEIVSDANQAEVKNLSLATQDMPDVYLTGLIDVTDIQTNPDMFRYYTDDMYAASPNFVKILAKDDRIGKYLKLADANIYSVPLLNETEIELFHDNLFMNKAWMDKLGLAVPNTIQEFENVLIAFRDNDCNGNGDPTDEIPYTFMLTHQYFGFDSMYAIFGGYDNSERGYPRLRYHEGKVTFTADKDDWKAATKWYASLYAQNLLDPEGFTQDRSTLFAKGKAETAVIGASSAFLMQNVVGPDRFYSDYTYVLPLLKADGSGDREAIFTYTPSSHRTRNVITSECPEEKVQRLCFFLDDWLTEENSFQQTYGKLGTYLGLYTGSEGYTYQFNTPPEGKSGDEFRFTNAPDAFGYYLPAASINKLEPSKQAKMKADDMESCRPYFNSDFMPPVLLTVEEAEELAQIQTTIKDFVKQKQAEWISGQSDIDAEWDSYKKQLQDMGVERYVAIYQAASDRYNAG